MKWTNIYYLRCYEELGLPQDLLHEVVLETYTANRQREARNQSNHYSSESDSDVVMEEEQQPQGSTVYRQLSFQWTKQFPEFRINARGLLWQLNQQCHVQRNTVCMFGAWFQMQYNTRATAAPRDVEHHERIVVTSEPTIAMLNLQNFGGNCAKHRNGLYFMYRALVAWTFTLRPLRRSGIQSIQRSKQLNVQQNGD